MMLHESKGSTLEHAMYTMQCFIDSAVRQWNDCFGRTLQAEMLSSASY